MACTATNSRPPCSDSVIDKTRARSLAARRCSRRVFSLDRRRPITGKTRWRRSGSSRIAPVVNRTRPWSRWRALNRGNPTRPPARRPALESHQLCKATTRSAIPDAYASLLVAAHQGATASLAWFHALRSAGRFHCSAGTAGSVVRASRLALTWASAQL